MTAPEHAGRSAPMHTTTNPDTTTTLVGANPQPALPAPRPCSCDGCERPLERHQVIVYEYLGTPVLSVCAECSPSRR